MRAADFLRDKAPYLLSIGFGTAFAGVLLAVLGVPPGGAVFLCLVFLLCALAPLCWEGLRKLSFYREALSRLEALEEKYLFAELLEPPAFCEGAILCAAVREMGASMTGRVADARRDAAEYREYVETWVHEVKTPIASARLLVENHPDALPQGVAEELFKIDGYVEQALFYARSGAVDRDYLVRAMSLEEAAAGAVRKYARPLIAAGFQVELAGLDATVYSDPKWTEFILGQLISNAVKYRGPAPRLTFTQTVGPDGVALHLSDNGPGIPPEDLPRVFDKGFTGQNGHAGPTKATGLGLYLCKKLCHRLGLGLTLTSPAGVTATLTFPKGRLHLAR